MAGEAMISATQGVVANCDGQCGRSRLIQLEPEVAAGILRKAGWRVEGDGPLAKCWCPDCVKAGRDGKAVNDGR